jgi:hypothetical protein
MEQIHIPVRTKAACYAVYNKALRLGDIVRPTTCAECGVSYEGSLVKLIQGHHEDYSKPLLVDWLCRKCHAKRHPRKKLRFRAL